MKNRNKTNANAGGGKNSRPSGSGKGIRRLEVAAAVVVLVVILLILGVQAVGAPPAIATEDPAILAPATPSAQVTFGPAAASPAPTSTPEPTSGRRPDCYTFLLVGIDKAAAQTDTIMVGMLDARAHKLYINSVPRDTLVDVPWSVKKVNSVYSNGIKAGDQELKGVDALKYEVSQIAGIPIDSYIVVDLQAFQALVDSVGGVTFDVPQNMYYSDPTQNLLINLKAGPQLLDGKSAMQLVRFRGYPQGDLQRIQVQQDFLKAVASQLLQIGNLSKVNDWAGIFKQYVDTNLTTSNLIWYGQQFMQLQSGDIVFNSIPEDLCDIRGGSYVSIQLNAWLDLLNTTINPNFERLTADDLNVLQWDAAAKTATSTRGVTYSLSAFYRY